MKIGSQNEPYPHQSLLFLFHIGGEEPVADLAPFHPVLPRHFAWQRKRNFEHGIDKVTLDTKWEGYQREVKDHGKSGHAIFS